MRVKKLLNFALPSIALIGIMALFNLNSVFASTGIYNMADVNTTKLDITVHDYDGKDATKITEDKNLFEPDENNSNLNHTITLKKDLSPAFVNLENSNYGTTAVTKGALSQNKLQKEVITTAGSTKDFITISNVEANDIIGVYWYGVDSKGKPGAANSMKISDSTKSETYTNSKSTVSPDYVEFLSPAGGTVTIGTTGSRISVAAITVSEAQLSAGSVTYTVTEGESYGTVSLKDSNSNDINNGDSLAGGTLVNLIVTPQSDDYFPVVSIDEEEVSLSDNSYAISVDGDINVSVAFYKKGSLVPIEESIVVNTDDYSKIIDNKNYSKVLPVGLYSASDYYFTLTGAAAVDPNKQRINITNKDTITFKTGNIDSATLKLSFAAMGDSSRTIKLGNEEIYTTTEKNTVVNESIELSANQEYEIKATNGFYIYSIEIVVSEQLTDINESVTNGVVVVKNNNVYVIAKVDKSYMDADSFAVTINGKEAKSTSTVYSAVQIDESTKFTAEDLGCAALYGLKITDVSSDQKVDIVKGFSVGVSTGN